MLRGHLIYEIAILASDESDLVGLSPIRFYGWEPTNLTPWVSYLPSLISIAL